MGSVIEEGPGFNPQYQRKGRGQVLNLYSIRLRSNLTRRILRDGGPIPREDSLSTVLARQQSSCGRALTGRGHLVRTASEHWRLSN